LPLAAAASWVAALRPDDAVLVTGGSHGVGAALAAQLAALGAHVVLTAPEEAAAAEAAVAAVAAARALRPAASPRVTGLTLEQGSPQSVAACVARLTAGRWTLRAVVLNAAAFAPGERGHAAVHRSVRVNALGPARLLSGLQADHLLPPDARLVATASFTARCVGRRALAASLARGALAAAPAYAASKAALGCAAAHFGAANGISVRLADPGLVSPTRLTRAWPPHLAAFAARAGGALRLRSSAEQGAAALLAALAWEAPSGSPRGDPPAYFFGAGGERLAPPACGGGDAALARDVWARLELLMRDDE